jgi:hypothetical protein
MLNPKYKVGDLVETWDSWTIGIVMEVQVCGLEMTIPRILDDEYAYIIRANERDVMYFQSELKLVS